MMDQDDILGNAGRFVSFVVFEPASIRVQDMDILFQGQEVKDIVSELTLKLTRSRKKSLPEQILYNRLVKITHMLNLLNSYEGVIISKFFDRIWRRYSYISHLGENFLDLKVYNDYFSTKTSNLDDIVAIRYDDIDSDDFHDETDDDPEDEDTEAVETDGTDDSKSKKSS